MHDLVRTLEARLPGAAATAELVVVDTGPWQPRRPGAFAFHKCWASCRRPPGPRRAFRRTGATRGSGSSARSGWRRSRRTRCSSITSLYQERSGLGGVRLPPSTHAGLAGLAKMGNGETPLTSAAAGTHLEVVRALFCRPARQSTRRTTAVELWLQGFYIGLLETQRGHGQP